MSELYYRISPPCLGLKIFHSHILWKGEEGISSELKLDSTTLVLIMCERACWFIALEMGVSSIPVSEVSKFLFDFLCM